MTVLEASLSVRHRMTHKVLADCGIDRPLLVVFNMLREEFYAAAFTAIRKFLKHSMLGQSTAKK